MSTSLVLASQSSRRADLLRQLGVEFSQTAADIDETPSAQESPEEYVERMAREKALRVLIETGTNLPVLGADTCVVLDDQVLGKPVDKLDAMAMLARLAGREHRVLTGVSICSEQRQEYRFSETRVRFMSLQREQVEAYIDTGDPFDKAGAYGIQGVAGAFVERIEGSYSGVVGLPLAETWQLLSTFSVATGLGPVVVTGDGFD
jgi:septum formation protein